MSIRLIDKIALEAGKGKLLLIPSHSSAGGTGFANSAAIALVEPAVNCKALAGDAIDILRGEMERRGTSEVLLVYGEAPEKFIYECQVHYGYERTSGISADN